MSSIIDKFYSLENKINCLLQNYPSNRETSFNGYIANDVMEKMQNIISRIDSLIELLEIDN